MHLRDCIFTHKKEEEKKKLFIIRKIWAYVAILTSPHPVCNWVTNRGWAGSSGNPVLTFPAFQRCVCCIPLKHVSGGVDRTCKVSKRAGERVRTGWQGGLWTTELSVPVRLHSCYRAERGREGVWLRSNGGECCQYELCEREACVWCLHSNTSVPSVIKTLRGDSTWSNLGVSCLVTSWQYVSEHSSELRKNECMSGWMDGDTVCWGAGYSFSGEPPPPPPVLENCLYC